MSHLYTITLDHAALSALRDLVEFGVSDGGEGIEARHSDQAVADALDALGMEYQTKEAAWRASRRMIAQGMWNWRGPRGVDEFHAYVDESGAFRMLSDNGDIGLRPTLQDLESAMWTSVVRGEYSDADADPRNPTT